MAAHTHSFGYWLRRRRKALDLTQEALAEAVSVSRFAIRKIESDERRPSRRLAERLADRLAVPALERAAFLDAARAVHAADRLALSVRPVDAPHAALGAPLGRSPTVTPPAEDAVQANHEEESAEPALAGLGKLPFVGREQEFGQLVGLVARLWGGHGASVLVEGEAGIGKSRLIHEVVRHASAVGVRALTAQCYEIEQAMPYQPLLELLGQALDLAGEALLQRMPPVSLAEIAALMPELAGRARDLPALSMQLPEARQARLARAIEQLFDVLAQRAPLLVVVDDVHWVDDASLRVLHCVARHAPGRRVLLVLTYRGEDVGADERVATLVESIRHEAHARHIVLARWSARDTRAFLAALAAARGTHDLGEWLHRETGGHPFFSVSILQSLLEQGLLGSPGRLCLQAAPTLPEALRASVRARISRVSRPARALLDAAAVLGKHFDFDTLSAIMPGVAASELLDALDALVQRRLLAEEGDVGVYDFSHDKVREAVYLDIGSARRLLLHRSVAEQLERQGLGEALAARVAEHYERAHEWPKAAHYLMLAARRSQHLFAMREALELLDRAVSIAEAHAGAVEPGAVLNLLEQRGAARAEAGQTAGAVADIERVIEAARQAGARERERDLLIRLGMAHRRADEYARATACLQQALSASRAMRDEPHVADTLYHLGTVSWSDGRNAQAIACHQEAVEICERLGLDGLVAVQAFHGRGETWFAAGQPARAIPCFERSIDLARRIGDRSYECENLMMIGWACSGSMGLADYGRALKHCTAALEIAEAADLEWHIGPIVICRDAVRSSAGAYGEAWTGLNAALQRLQAHRLERFQLMACNMLGCLLLDLNRCTQAVGWFERGLSIAGNIRTMFWQPLLVANLAIARAREGRLDLQGELQTALQFSEENGEQWMALRCLEAFAELCRASGDSARGVDYADRLLTLATRGGMRELVAQAERWRGEALLGGHAYAEAERALQAAARGAEAVGRLRLQWDVARAQARLHWLRRQAEAAAEREREAAALASRISEGLRGSDLVFAAAR